ncbi:hypothetical protein [Hyphomicrobium sp. DY-1]|uniref:hypothetical protein n=1 Tax=Hyphomicrobium sp. DY-1 TaxID=3075650 RepID=UPI0039C0CDE0
MKDPADFSEKTWFGKIEHRDDGDPTVYVRIRASEFVILLIGMVAPGAWLF